MQHNNMDTIIFDLGGVLIDWNPRYMYRKIFQTEAEMEDFLANVCTLDWNEQQDAGFPIAQATEQLIERFPNFEAYIRAYYDRWTEMLNGAIEPNVELLTRLYESKKYRLFALTNWSGELFPYALKTFPFLQFFQGILVSGDEKMRKPEPRIFLLTMDRFGIKPQNALFLDDNLRNVKAAEQVGLNAIHVQSPEQLAADLNRRGIEF